MIVTEVITAVWKELRPRWPTRPTPSPRLDPHDALFARDVIVTDRGSVDVSTVIVDSAPLRFQTRIGVGGKPMVNWEAYNREQDARLGHEDTCARLRDGRWRIRQ